MNEAEITVVNEDRASWTSSSSICVKSCRPFYQRRGYVETVRRRFRQTSKQNPLPLHQHVKTSISRGKRKGTSRSADRSTDVRFASQSRQALLLVQTKLSKLDLVRYYLSVAPGALAGIRDRPIVLKRFVDGAEGQAFYQKRAPANRPEWLRTTTLSFPSGRKAEEVVVDDAAGLAWVVNLGCIELHPHPVRSKRSRSSG